MNAELYSLNFPNGKKYIGMSKDAKGRFVAHKAGAARGGKLPIHNALRKYGVDVGLQILCVGEKNYISDLEIKAIATYSTQKIEFGYNVCPGGEFNSLGIKRSKETCAKISAALMGKPLSKEHCAKLKGYKHTVEAKVKMRSAKLGRSLSEEQRQKISVGGKGRVCSDESRKRYSESRTGAKNPMYGKTHSEAAREKIAAAGKGRKCPRSAEQKARMSAIKTGVPWSAERRAAHNAKKAVL